MQFVRVVLADDHAVVRAGIRRVVEEIPGLKVVAEVGSGPELLPVIEQFQPDCMLIDVAMPDFDPVKTIHQIRLEYPEMTILVVSAYNDDIYVQGLLSAGVNGYHLKDQPLHDLQLALQRVLAGERWLSSPLIERLVRQKESQASLPQLTARQKELARLLKKGLDNYAIAAETGLSIKTIENHLTRLYRQLRVHSRLEAANFVMEHPEILGITGETAIQSQPQIDQGSQKQLTVLVVDDNARYRQQLQRMIGKVCPQAIIYEADNIEMAAHLAQRLAPKLALVDVVLGEEEDGIRCTRRIKAISPLSRVILISAYPDREFHRLGLKPARWPFWIKKT